MDTLCLMTFIRKKVALRICKKQGEQSIPVLGEGAVAILYMYIHISHVICDTGRCMYVWMYVHICIAISVE